MSTNVGLPELKSEFLFTLSGTVGEPLDIGSTPKGERRIFPITGGELNGPRLNGQVLEGGSDALLVRHDGVMIYGLSPREALHHLRGPVSHSTVCHEDQLIVVGL
jgi:hypothetical protein